MSSILTDTLKRDLVQKLFNENEGTRVGDSDNNYYIAIGRSEVWSDPTNASVNDTTIPGFSVNKRDEREFRYRMQSVKAVEAFSWVVPKRDWTAGDTYYEFSDWETTNHPAAQSPYVITEDNNVYVCIRSNKNAAGEEQPSDQKPDHTNNTLTLETDGYIWKYLYTISTPDANSFMTAAWMPCKYVDSAAAGDPYFGQYLAKTGAAAGSIVAYDVINGGTGYSNTSGAITLSVVGNGSGATCRAIVQSNGVIGHVMIGDSAGVGVDITKPTFNDALGSGYDYANVKITINSGGGSGAIIKPVFAPVNGLGYNPIEDLKANAIMFNIKPEADEQVNGSPTFVVNQDYRQVGLLRNPLNFDSDNDVTKFTGLSGLALKQMKLDGQYTGLTFRTPDTISKTGGTAKALLDWSDAGSPTRIWYHQDDINTGFEAFADGDTISIGATSGITADSAAIRPDVNPHSGDLLFLSNIEPITRDAVQTEDIKVVIRL